jgi:hypothetical protein
MPESLFPIAAFFKSARDQEERGGLELNRKKRTILEPPEATFARNPCIHAGPDNPVVRNNAALGRLKSMEKPVISTVFFGFFAIFAENNLFYEGFFGFFDQCHAIPQQTCRGDSQLKDLLNAARREPSCAASKKPRSAYSVRPPSVRAA